MNKACNFLKAFVAHGLVQPECAIEDPFPKPKRRTKGSSAAGENNRAQRCSGDGIFLYLYKCAHKWVVQVAVLLGYSYEGIKNGWSKSINWIIRHSVIK